MNINKIEQLKNDWLANETADTTLEAELTARTYLLIQFPPAVVDEFKRITTHFGQSSETHDYKQLRDAAIGVLTALEKRSQESDSRRMTPRTMSSRPRFNYGR